MPSSDTQTYLKHARHAPGGPMMQVHYTPDQFIGHKPRDPKVVVPVDDSGYELCERKKCDERAINYSGRCVKHGGLHGPLGMSRLDRFRLGFIGVEQLDDQELQEGCCRNTNGKVPYAEDPSKRSMVTGALMTQEQYRSLVTELYKRHDDRLRGMLDKAIDTMYNIMVSPDEDAADRIKAATWIFDRIRGKTPESVKISLDPKPFEALFAGIARGGRDELAQPLVIEAEVETEEDSEDD